MGITYREGVDNSSEFHREQINKSCCFFQLRLQLALHGPQYIDLTLIMRNYNNGFTMGIWHNI